jgi:hypothetical protein
MIMCWYVSHVRKKYFEKPLDSKLWDYIIINKPNMELVLMVNKIKEHLVAPCFVFAQIFQLWSYGQYGMQMHQQIKIWCKMFYHKCHMMIIKKKLKKNSNQYIC